MAADHHGSHSGTKPRKREKKLPAMASVSECKSDPVLSGGREVWAHGCPSSSLLGIFFEPKWWIYVPGNAVNRRKLQREEEKEKIPFFSFCLKKVVYIFTSFKEKKILWNLIQTNRYFKKLWTIKACPLNISDFKKYSLPEIETWHFFTFNMNMKNSRGNFVR